ncbi:hypothetical protein RclHR1_08010003 [Rhizophagus clarus]|uniref:Uncharacterized protein n=1 Tax=Rhizophagus clarus TaxID=94130 RepID=A0A2Z6S641_9GLOM|nr:hypothetical protein RclHR1_08010003 [Rhizophagus clarus]
MKVLPKSARETKEQFFGKKGWTLHSVLIAYSINRHVKLGFDISSGKDIENAISGICGTSVSHLEPDRKKVNLEKEETSYLVFPIVLDNTNYLSSYDLYSDKGKNLIRDGNKVTLNPSSQFLFWPLACRWVLKSAQKFGRKGGGKHISKKVWNLLQKYFLEGNVNKSERHTAESMLTQLKKNVEDGVIEEEKVPKLETIRNWISRYASQHCQEAAIVVQVSRT